MATQKFTGVIPPVVVPDTEDHQLDVASFERSINRMIDAGVDGLFFLGSSGEVVFSTDERRRQIIAEAVRIVDHRTVRSLRSWPPMLSSPPARSMPCRA